MASINTNPFCGIQGFRKMVKFGEHTKAETCISKPCLSIASFKQATTSLPACKEFEVFRHYTCMR